MPEMSSVVNTNTRDLLLLFAHKCLNEITEGGVKVH